MLRGEQMIINGDCLEVMKTLEANSVDAIVTDPPYGWSFMNKAWDNFAIEKRRQQEFNRPPRKDGKSRGQGDPSLCAGLYNQSLEGNKAFQQFTENWAREAFRVLKPGGHALIFCGPRTYHRMASGVENAGFEIRDQLQWLFGSGFPKSHDISKAIDKAAGAEREVVGKKTFADGSSTRDTAGKGEKFVVAGNSGLETAPATEHAKQWQGFGTALKPANEPIVLARKPLEKGLTVAENVLKYGTGALNVDGSRIGSNPGYKYPNGPGGSNENTYGEYAERGPVESSQGRWPANVLLDEAAAEMLDEQSGHLHAPGSSGGGKTFGSKTDQLAVASRAASFKDSGGASRFFYVAKASKRERNAGLEGMPEREKKTLNEYVNPSEGRTASKSGSPSQNFHPTVKPIKLMEYLCKLITPPKGIILDPFMGSGTTGVAAKRLGFEFIGIEMSEEYCEIAHKRIEHAKEQAADKEPDEINQLEFSDVGEPA